MSASAKQWNEMIDKLIRHQFLGSYFGPANDWRHPWQLLPWWDPKQAQWRLAVHSGFVNGLEAIIPMDGEKAPSEALERLLLAGKKKPKKGENVDVWLSEGATMELSNWRAIGMDATPSGASVDDKGQVRMSFEAVPPYFAALGVGKAPTIKEDATGLVATEADSNARLLRAVEVVLRKDRKATRSNFTAGIGVDGQNLQFDVTSYSSPTARKRPYLRQVSNYKPSIPADPLQRLMGVWQADPWDDLHLGTIYMVSPIKAPLGSDPDASWMPYVSHLVFWNLLHATNQPTETAEAQNLTLQTGLAGGIGDNLNNYLLAQINDANSAVSQYLGSTEIEGRFWSV